MELAEPGHDQILVLRLLEMDRDIGLKPADINRVHRAAQIHRQLLVRGLKVEQLRHDPERADAFGDGHAHHARNLGGRALGVAENIEADLLHRARGAENLVALGRQLQSRLQAHEQREAQLRFQPVDPAHRGGAGDAEHFGGFAETQLIGAGKKNAQIVPRHAGGFRRLLHVRSTPLPLLLHPKPTPAANVIPAQNAVREDKIR